MRYFKRSKPQFQAKRLKQQLKELKANTSVIECYLLLNVVALIIAMSLWPQDSIEDVLKNLVHGLSSQWVRLSQRWKNPSKSSISEARQRVGPQVMSQLFHLVARPLGSAQTPGVFLNGLRMMAVDGSTLDLPDTDANARVFGYPGTRAGTEASFPKARLVLLIEVGTHLITDALLSPYRVGERIRALKLLRSVGPGMLRSVG